MEYLEKKMIKLTRLNNKPFFINALYIETVESFPDTTILLTNGKRFVVQEDEDSVVKLIEEFYRRIQILSHDQFKEDGET